MAKDIIGSLVKGTIDRPLGSAHPDYPDLIYTVNYGYVDGAIAGDGEEQDVYVLGTEKPLETFAGKVIAIYHRTNDDEDKWIVSLDGKNYTDEEILSAIRFQEQYFEGRLLRQDESSVTETENGNLDRIRNMNIIIKKIETEEEINGKGYVHWKSWHEAYPGIVAKSYLDKMTLEKCQKIAHSGIDNNWIAKDGDDVVGFITFGNCRDEDLADAGEIFAIYVLEKYYGSGLGYLLMEKALEELGDRGKIALWVFKDNPRAIRFYRRFGFKSDQEERVFLLDEPAETIRMVLDRNATDEDDAPKKKKERFFRLISNQVRFGCGYRTVQERRQYFAFHGSFNRNDDYFVNAEISEEEFEEIEREYPETVCADRQTAESFREKYIEGHRILLEGWNKLL